jgi:outer membrane protein OmpA-like peptidoglycan-associated protein
MTMTRLFLTTAAIALVAATPASAQILGGGGGIGGGIGGTLGGVGGGIGGGIGGTVNGTLRTTERLNTEARARARAAARLEKQARIDRRAARASANVLGDAALNGSAARTAGFDSSARAAAAAELALDLPTRGVAAATRRGLRQAGETASGVPVFVSAQVAAPAVSAPAISVGAVTAAVPSVAIAPYPVYAPGAYYVGPETVFVDSGHVHYYMDQQYRDLQREMEGTGTTVFKRGDALVIQMPADVTFAFDKSDIQQRFYRPLNAVARTLATYPGTDVEVIGHTDSVGTDSYNLGLSERRGRSVAEFFAARDVEPSRMVVEAMGESQPIATNATDRGRAANRRVEIVLHPRAG